LGGSEYLLSHCIAGYLCGSKLNIRRLSHNACRWQTTPLLGGPKLLPNDTVVKSEKGSLRASITMWPKVNHESYGSGGDGAGEGGIRSADRLQSDGASMRPLMMAGCLVLLSVLGCASMRGTSTRPAPAGVQVVPPPGVGLDADLRTQAPVAAAPAIQPVAPSVDNTGRPSSVGVEHPDATGSVSAATNSSTTKSSSSPVNHPVKQGAPAPALLRPAAPATTSNKASPETPTLDLAALEQRLRDTHAIGVFTKLSLKNQVDDLLNAFRALYRGPNKRPTPELRQRYDLLLLKVLSLLQDSDPQLAAAISSSREAIWGILADPDKLATI
jgi:hypothetical protein